jgi:hypothetical protein
MRIHAAVIGWAAEIIMEQFGEGDGSRKVILQDRPGNGPVEVKVLGGDRKDRQTTGYHQSSEMLFHRFCAPSAYLAFPVMKSVARI